MSNNYRKIVVDRRNKVALAMAKSVTKPQAIAESIGEDVGVIYDGIAHLKKQATPWLDDLAFTGFVWECKNAIDKLKDIEVELQSLRQNTNNLDDKLRVIHELEYNINLQMETLGNGPTLMALKKANGE